MGRVYRARDLELGREVALKVLSTDLAGDGSFMQRFRREARVLATLNHPDIAALYELLEKGGRPHLILELVEGETLEKRLSRGPLAIDEALRPRHGRSCGSVRAQGASSRELTSGQRRVGGDCCGRSPPAGAEQARQRRRRWLRGFPPIESPRDLFGSQRHDGIDTCCPARWKVTGEKGDEREDGGAYRHHNRVGGPHLVQLA